MVRKIQINLQKLLFLNFWFWESSNEMKHTCFWVIFDLLNHGCCSVAHSCPILCDPHGLQHTRLSCPSPSPGACSNACPLGQWGHPTISYFAIPFSFCLQTFPPSGSFPVSQLFKSGGQSIAASAYASVLLMDIQGWFPLGLTGLTALLFKGLSRVVLEHHSLKASIFQCGACFTVQVSQPYMTTGKKTIALTLRICVGKVMSLLFNTLSRFISW